VIQDVQISLLGERGPGNLHNTRPKKRRRLIAANYSFAKCRVPVNAGS
jgi:hypothetical protein